MLEADDDLKNWTKMKLELEEEEDARIKAETAREEGVFKKAILEVEWSTQSGCWWPTCR